MLQQEGFDIGWLDFDAEGLRNAREFLQGLSKPGTVDELGFGRVRQLFADLFFPCTNTQTRRARYYFFLPLVCRLVEQKGLGARDLEELENRLRRALMKVKPRQDGVIGAISGDRLHRKPSSIYWGALLELGIAERDVARGTYLARSWEFNPAGMVVRDDDRTRHRNEDCVPIWSERVMALISPLLTTAGALPAQIFFELKTGEAAFLADRFGRLDERRRAISVMGAVITAKDATRFTFPWDLEIADEALRRRVEKARLYSRWARGANLSYYHVVTAKRHRLAGDVPDPDVWRVGFAEWWAEAVDDLGAWDIGALRDELVEIHQLLGAAGAPPSLRFAELWMARYRRADSSDALLDDPELETVLQTQEWNGKKGRARLINEERLRHTEFWKGESGAAQRSYQLDYRAPRGRQVLHDILDGLSKVVS